MDLFQKISGHEAKAWVVACLKARGIELEDAEVVSLIDSCRPEDFKNPRRPRVSKKVSSSSSERSEADYEPTKCDARVWLKGGYAGQCSCKKGSDRLCKRHQSEADKNDGAVKNGFFNEARPDYHYGDESKSFIPWHDSTVCKPVKDTSSSTDKPKKPRICSLCKCAGHNKRACPTLKKADEPSPESATEPEPAAEPEPAPESAPDPTPEQVPEPEPAPEDLSDDEGEPIESSHDALHMCIAGAAADEGAQPELDEDLSDDEEEGETIDCTYESVAYTRNTKDEVFDDDFERVGTWVDGAIKFTPEGAANHLSNPDRS